MSEIEQLLDRLQTGWQPEPDEIDPAVTQRALKDWDFWKSGHTLIGYPSDEAGWREVDVLWLDAGLRWALCSDGIFYWLMP